MDPLTSIADDGTVTINITQWLDPIVAKNLVGATGVATTSVSGVQVDFKVVVTPKTKFPVSKK